jgi:hypothetical protein
VKRLRAYPENQLRLEEFLSTDKKDKYRWIVARRECLREALSI